MFLPNIANSKQFLAVSCSEVMWPYPSNNFCLLFNNIRWAIALALALALALSLVLPTLLPFLDYRDLSRLWVRGQRGPPKSHEIAIWGPIRGLGAGLVRGTHTWNGRWLLILPPPFHLPLPPPAPASIHLWDCPRSTLSTTPAWSTPSPGRRVKFTLPYAQVGRTATQIHP